MAQKFGMVFFRGQILDQGIFWVLIFAPIIIPVIWNPEYPPPPPWEPSKWLKQIKIIQMYVRGLKIPPSHR